MSNCCCGEVTPGACTACSSLPSTGVLVTVAGLEFIYSYPPQPDSCDSWTCVDINGQYLATQNGSSDTNCQWKYTNSSPSSCDLLDLSVITFGTALRIEMKVRYQGRDNLILYSYQNIPPEDCSSWSNLACVYASGAIAANCRIVPSICYVTAVN